MKHATAPTTAKAVPAFLIRRIPAFAEYPRYLALGKDKLDSLEGVVCGAFARFLVDLQERAGIATLGTKESESLEEAYRVIEALVRTESADIQNLVVTEVLENLDASDETMTTILARLGPGSRALYERYLR